MKKYYIGSGHGTNDKFAWVISEVEMDKPGKYPRELVSGKFVKRLASDFYIGALGTPTGAKRPWRFRDNAWECAALLIKMLFHDTPDPFGDEPWLEIKNTL